MTDISNTKERLPRWMKSQLPSGENYSKVKRLITEHKLNTICTSGNCPNKGECWNAGTRITSYNVCYTKLLRNQYTARWEMTGPAPTGSSDQELLDEIKTGKVGVITSYSIHYTKLYDLAVGDKEQVSIPL